MADDSLFQINLVTPERILFNGMASEVVLRTGEGDVGKHFGRVDVDIQSGSVRNGVDHTNLRLTG